MKKFLEQAYTSILAFVVFIVLVLIWGFPVILVIVYECCWLLLYIVWWVPAIGLTSLVVHILNKIDP